MKQFVLCAGLLLWVVSTAVGQQFAPLHLAPAQHAAYGGITTPDGKQVQHRTDLVSAEAIEAIRAFHDARKAGLLPKLGKASQPPEIGDQQEFRVHEGEEWISRTFVLKAKSELFHIWVDSAEVANGNVTDEEVDVLRGGLLEAIPEDLLFAPDFAFNPEMGIMANDEAVFGDPPNYDGDGVVDVLLYDIGGNDAKAVTLGYVSSTDINPNAGSGQGNQADVLYLDSKEGTSDFSVLLAVAAHEYTHLIHFNYLDLSKVWSTTALTFLMEGVAEYAIHMNGLFFRGVPFLSDPHHVGRPLLDWNSESYGALDYERAGLFTTYLASQTSADVAGAIVQSGLTNAEAYRQALQGTGFTLEDIVLNYHTANFLNDVDLDARYGHVFPAHTGVTAAPMLVVDGSAVSTHSDEHTVEAGSVNYIVFRNVADFLVTVDVDDEYPAVLIPDLRNRVIVRAFIEHANGSREIRDLGNVGESQHAVDGEIAEVTLAIIHNDPDKTSPLEMDVEASWNGGSSQILTLAHDDGTGESPFTFGADADGAVATRFDLPDPDAQLRSVFVAPFYLSEFSNGGQPANAPRDVNVTIWESNEDGTPGEELLSVYVEDPRPMNSSLNPTFFEVDLTPHQDQLPDPLPASLFVGYKEAGSDENYMVVVVSNYEEEPSENVSFIGNATTGSWTPLWDVELTDGTSMQEKLIPIRVELLVSSGPVAAESVQELPERVTLYPNYPNPFNPTTTIRYALPQGGNVRLVVYDVLGREVATLVDTVQPAGEHEVRLDAAGWASGLYFYTLEAVGQKQARRMMLVK